MFGTINPRTAPVYIGIDVGSTTVKAVVVDPVDRQILWSDYQRHQTKQPEKVLEFLQRIEAAFRPAAGHHHPQACARCGDLAAEAGGRLEPVVDP